MRCPWGCWYILRALGACERGPGDGSLSTIALFLPQAMTSLEQPLKPPSTFAVQGGDPCHRPVLELMPPFARRHPACLLHPCKSGEGSPSVPELPLIDARQLCSRKAPSAGRTVSSGIAVLPGPGYWLWAGHCVPNSITQGPLQSWPGWLDSGRTRHQARLAA